jgi:hypothetical protein
MGPSKGHQTVRLMVQEMVRPMVQGMVHQMGSRMGNRRQLKQLYHPEVLGQEPEPVWSLHGFHYRPNWQQTPSSISCLA